MKKSKGNVGDIMSVCVIIMLLSILMISYLHIMGLIEVKQEVSQIARQYILKIETVGYLTGSDRTLMLQELSNIGVENIDLTGTTTYDAGYGNTVILQLKGDIKALQVDGMPNTGIFNMVFRTVEFPVAEKRMSTAKN
jgi:type II secretory pathway pseudopilin PulG